MELEIAIVWMSRKLIALVTIAVDQGHLLVAPGPLLGFGYHFGGFVAWSVLSVKLSFGYPFYW